MKKLMIYVFFATSVSLLFFGCSGNKNSDEACQHQVTMDLDHGNYNAVLASACAGGMDKGAAYFGKAGFDVKNVINNFSKTGVTSGATTTQSDLNVYMTNLVTSSSGTSLQNMDKAVSSYQSVTTTSGKYTTDNYKDAQFYVSLVSAVKSLSLITMVVPNLLDASGNLNTACDNNNNNVPDVADASSCALIAAARISSAATQTCTGATYSPAVPVALTLKDSSGLAVPGTYSGLDITITPAPGGTTATCVPANTTTYRKLLYKDAITGKYWVATTGADVCTDANNSSNKWPCPIVQNNQPLDLVTTIDQTLNTSISSLGTSLSGTSSTDVQTAILDIQAQACCGCTTTPCPACPTACTSQNIANYLQTLH